MTEKRSTASLYKASGKHWCSHTWLDVSCKEPAVAQRFWDVLIMLFSVNNMAEEEYCYLQISNLVPIQYQRRLLLPTNESFKIKITKVLPDTCKVIFELGIKL